MAANLDAKQSLIVLYNEVSTKRDELYESTMKELNARLDGLSMHRSYDKARQNVLDEMKNVIHAEKGGYPRDPSCEICKELMGLRLKMARLELLIASHH
jgi:hypothetical protein